MPDGAKRSKGAHPTHSGRRRPLSMLATVVVMVVLAALPWLASTDGSVPFGGSAGPGTAADRGQERGMAPDPLDPASVGAAVAERAPDFPRPGSIPPGFALPLLESEAPYVGSDTVRLSDFLGRWVYLDVFGSWCPPCRRKQPKMLEIASELETRGAVVLGLLIGDRPRTAVGWLEANGGMAYPYLVLDAETERAWGMTGAPMGFLISPQGRVERLCYGCSGGPNGVETLPDAVR